MKKNHPPAMAIFGSSNWDIAVNCYSRVYKTGQLIAQKGYTLIYGVGDVGMMGAAYSGARSAGGKVLGVTIPVLLKRQCADPSIFKRGELKLVKTLEERKKIMVTRADVILVAPGGWGTLDEIGTFGVRFKIGEWPAVPVIFLNYNHYWDGFLKFMKQMVKDKAVRPNQMAFVGSIRSPKKLFTEIKRVKTQMEKYQ
ncbi:MAG: TIGR00730 family Rossman fold protein [Alphaproteobacteria bacterium]|nr:TIGR00730 family Rossman fold protein [Alphaproteobacteria bacterium]